jgi:hypothetical protein
VCKESFTKHYIVFAAIGDSAEKDGERGKHKRNPMPLTASAAPDCAFLDQFDARGRNHLDELSQLVDISRDDPVLGF